MKYHGLRVLTDRLKQRSSGVAAMITKLNGCQLNHDIALLAIDALQEYGLLRRGSRQVRDQGRWQSQYMFSLGLIIGGGTAQIQKNIISERGLGMPREPKSVRKRAPDMDFGLCRGSGALSNRRSAATSPNASRSAHVRAVMESERGHDPALLRGSRRAGGDRASSCAEEHGGSGLGLLDAAIAAEELGRAATPVSFHSACVMAPVALADGRQRCQAMRAVATRHRGEGLAVRLAGQRRRGPRRTVRALRSRAPFAPDAAIADAFVLTNRRAGTSSSPRDAPGLSVGAPGRGR